MHLELVTMFSLKVHGHVMVKRVVLYDLDILGATHAPARAAVVYGHLDCLHYLLVEGAEFPSDEDQAPGSSHAMSPATTSGPSCAARAAT